jgi:AbrB family looped-hinge helix DNA binding protein
MQSQHQEMIRSHVRVDSARRVVLPNSVCRALGIQPGDELTVLCTADGVQLQTVEQAVREFQSLCAPGMIEGRSVVDELIAERRAASQYE